jgi:predicted nuclease of predicted toxin-antitoxin system
VRLLLDCHISKATVQALRKRFPSIDAEHLAAWRAGAFLRATDEDILAECHRERRLFVTFDQRTIPDLLRFWAAEQRPHSGVIFGDENTVKPSHPGGVAGAIARLAREIGNSDTTNLIRFLRPATAG